MTTQADAIGKIVAELILKAYGDIDNFLGKRIEELAAGDATIAKNALLTMANAHFEGGMALLQMSGMSHADIASKLLELAQRHINEADHAASK